MGTEGTKQKIRFDPDRDLHPKQLAAFRTLQDPSVLATLYGGSIGAGKTELGCYWVVFSAWRFASTRWAIVRTYAKDLIGSTLKSLFKILRRHDIPFQWNQSTRTITLQNQSEIVYGGADISTDPELVNWGGIDLTGAYLDECASIDLDVYRTMVERLRHNIPEETGGHILLTSNPTKNWLYTDVYCLWEKGLLPPQWRYIPALPHDNPHLKKIKGYLERLTLEELGEWKYQTRVLGNWHYESGDGELYLESDILDCHHWSEEVPQGETPEEKAKREAKAEKYLSCDVGGHGARSDRTILVLWRELVAIDVIELKQRTIPQIRDEIMRLVAKHAIPIRNVVIDELNLGQGLVDLIRGCTPFRANAKAHNSEPYANLKSQCYHRLAELIAKKEIRFKFATDWIGPLSKELAAHKRFNADRDQPQRVTPKEQVTRSLGHSPDVADAVMMRMIYMWRAKAPSMQIIDWDWKSRRRA